MTVVHRLLKTKGSQVYSVLPKSTVLEALQLMAEKKIGAVPVVEHGQLLGIFSERDYARRGILEGRTSDAMVEDLMTSEVFFVRPDNTLEDCMCIMTEQHVRHLPVVESGEVVGIVSIGDVVKVLIEDQHHVIEGLENYIMGREQVT
jgi:CBS domain-containing protein